MTTSLLLARDDRFGLFILGLFVLSLFWIFFLKDKFWRAILGPPPHEVLSGQTKALLEQQINKAQTWVEELRSEIAAKEERARNGKSPLTVETIEQRRRSLDSLSQMIANSRNAASLQPLAKTTQGILEAYLKTAIEIKSDSLQELESALAAAESAQSRTGATSAAESIGELRAHINAARNSLAAAKAPKELRAVAPYFDAAEKSIQAAETIANALRMAGLV